MKKCPSEHNVKPAICFVSHYAYGVLASIDTGHIGGVERQTSMMAKWFAERGYKVSMLTLDEGQEDGVEIDGVKVFKMCRKDQGIKGLRFFWPKWTSLISAMKRANADIYYYNIGDLGLGQIVMWCRRHGKKCVYSVANDPDCEPDFPLLKPLRERILYKYGLLNVDSVIAQTEHQQQMLMDGFGIKSTVIKMPCSVPSGYCAEISDNETNSSQHILWVGRICEQKRFEWLLDVAEKCPDITFDVVGSANKDSEYVSDLIERSAEIPNVKIHGRVLHEDMFEYYRSTSLLCCTSLYEGFPNTFLEAWSCGIPIVSTFDPDGLIAKYNLGWTASSIEELINAIKEALEDRAKWKTASRSAREYYLKNHTQEACLPKFERLFQEVSGIQA